LLLQQLQEALLLAHLCKLMLVVLPRVAGKAGGTAPLIAIHTHLQGSASVDCCGVFKL